jgi:hypothetical protein
MEGAKTEESSRKILRDRMGGAKREENLKEQNGRWKDGMKLPGDLE